MNFYRNIFWNQSLNSTGKDSQMGYFSDQKGLMMRYIDECEYWEPHLNNSKKFITACLSQKRKIQSVAVFGSGWLLDIPIDYLIKNFEIVYLVDIIHPQQIIHKYGFITNLRFEYFDLTGGMIDIITTLRKNDIHNLVANFVNCLQNSKMTHKFDADFYVSVVGLDQLVIYFIDYLKRYTLLSEKHESLISKKIQADHLKMLSEHPSILITDYEEYKVSNKTGFTNIKNLIFIDLPESKSKEEWIWNFDTLGNYNSGYKTSFLVKAIEITP